MVWRVDPPAAATLCAVHDAGMVEFLRTARDRFRVMEDWPADRPLVPDTFPHPSDHFPNRSDSPWAELGRRCSDTAAPIFEGTWRAATSAVQVSLAAAIHVAASSETAYALCRPPGHHAGRARFGGFCYLNNAAVAAHHLSIGAVLADLGLPTVIVQEGGYHLPSLGASVVGTLRAWA